MTFATDASVARDQAVSRAVDETIWLARYAGQMGWIPATSGNFSVRIDSDRCAITASGGFKQDVTKEGVLVAAIGSPGDTRVPGASAEAPLHFQLYRDSAEIGAVAHVHSHAAAVLSRRHEHVGALRFQGWEILKAFPGIDTHDTCVDIAIFSNDQDIDRLAALVHDRLVQSPGSFGYLIAGHGLYAWGADVAETRRHLEAFDALLNLQLEEERRS